MSWAGSRRCRRAGSTNSSPGTGLPSRSSTKPHRPAPAPELHRRHHPAAKLSLKYPAVFGGCLRVSGLGGRDEGGQSTLVGRVRVDAGIEECPDRLGVSPSRSVDQGCVRMRMGGVRARTSNASTPKRCAAVRSDAGVRRAGTSDAPCGPRTIRRCGGRPFPRRLPVRVERNAPAGSRRLIYYCAPPPVSREIVAST